MESRYSEIDNKNRSFDEKNNSKSNTLAPQGIGNKTWIIKGPASQISQNSNANSRENYLN